MNYIIAFSGPADRVECYGCGTIMDNWCEWPNPKLRHLQTAPACPLVPAFQNEHSEDDNKSSGATGYLSAAIGSRIQRIYARTGNQQMPT